MLLFIVVHKFTGKRLKELKYLIWATDNTDLFIIKTYLSAF